MKHLLLAAMLLTQSPPHLYDVPPPNFIALDEPEPLCFTGECHDQPEWGLLVRYHDRYYFVPRKNLAEFVITHPSWETR